MLDKAEVDKIVRLAVLECFVVQQGVRLARLLRREGITDDQIEADRTRLLQHLRGLTIPGLDPATSDLVASAIEERTEMLLGQMRDIERQANPPK